MRKDKNKALLLTIILIASAIIQPVKPARVSAVEAMTSITLRSTATVTAGIEQIIDGNLTLNGFTSNIEGATVKIAGNFDVGKDVLSVDTTGAPSLTASYDSSGGILTISGSASSGTYQAVLRTVKFYTTGSSTSRNIVLSVNKAASTAQYNSLTGHYYEFITFRGITWTDARIAAETREIAGQKGYLATVTTAQENEFLTTTCQGYGWLGGSDAGHEGQWYWVTGPEGAANNGNGTKFVTQRASGGGVQSTESGMYQNFRTSPAEPNNDAAGGENYLHMLSGADNGKWNDFPNYVSYIDGYLVEYGMVSMDNLGANPPISVSASITLTVTQNQPVASNVRITGTAKVGLVLTGGYDYSDINGDLEGASTFQWYRSENAAGAGRTAIAGGTGLTYTLQTADLGKYISFEVTPKALAGILIGTAVESARTTAVLPAEAAPVASNVRITGTAKVDLTLTGAYDYSDINGDLQGTSILQWYRSDSVSGDGRIVIAGATGLTYTLQEADLGKYISFEVTPKALTGILTGIEVESARTTAVLPAEAAPVASNVRITGTAKVGLTLTGGYDYSDINGDLEEASTFQWYRSENAVGIGRTVIAGATGLTYILQTADLGKYISFEVTPKALTGILTGTATESTRTAAVLPAEAAPVASNVRITGTAKVGLTLTGGYDYSDINGDLEGTSAFQWYRANNTSGDGKTAIAGVTGLTYTLQEADLGKYISFEIIPKALTGILTGTATESTRTAAVLPAEAAPIASNVRITGTTKVGLTLTGAYDYSDINGDLEGISMFQWYRANSASGDGKIAITGATGLTYTLQEADLGKCISFEVTPKALTGVQTGTAAESVRTATVLPAEAAPAASNVRITGTAKVGLTLTGSYDYSDINGDLEGTSTFQWYRADSASGDGKIAIAGATGLTYTLQEADLGKYISFEVIPKALTGILTGISAESARTAAVLPVEAAPIASNVRITGTTKVGLTLTGGYDYSDINGDLEGTSMFQWYRSDSTSGDGKTAITGATGLTYTLQEADLGKYISFEVTPKALTGILTSTAVESARTTVVLPAEAAPVVSNVRITGTAKVGLTLTGGYDYSDINGDLEGTSTFQWYHADSASGDGRIAITGATGLTYTLQEADLGKYISFEVIPKALTGILTGTSAESTRTAAVLPAEAAPIASNVRITGTAKVGLTLTGGYDYSDINGDLEGISIFQWYRSDNSLGIGKVAITGETGLTYILQASDLDKYISFEVTPKASTGILTGTAVESARTTAVLPAEAAPAASNVRITGTAKVGLTLTGGYDYSDINGDLEGTSTFQWYRSENVAGAGRTAIAGATGLNYTLQEADLGKYISFEVTPKALTGILTGTAVESVRTTAVLPVEAAPVASNVRIIGTAKVGLTLTGAYDYSDINGDLEGTSTFQWYRADSASGDGRIAITGATGLTYTLQEADLGKYVSFEVTPKALTGILTGIAAESARTTAVLPAEAAPMASNVRIAGTAKVGLTLTGAYDYSDINGDLEGISMFQWYRSDSISGTGKAVIAGAAGLSYMLQEEDLGKYISFEVTPIAQTGSVTGAAIECILTTAVLPAEAAPAASNVRITGIAKVGLTLTGAYDYSDINGDMEGTSMFQWYRSDSTSGTGKSAITGETGLSYMLQGEDLGKYISFKVTPVAQSGSVTGAAIECTLTTAVLPAEAAPVASNVRITGTTKVGLILTGGYDYSDINGDMEGTSMFQWYRSDNTSGTGKAAMAGATGLTYTLKEMDLGKYISFEVTPIAQTGSITGAAAEYILTSAVLPAESIPENTPPTAINATILGMAKQGEQLVGSYQYSDADGDPEGSSVFAWYRSNDTAGTGKAPIPGSTGISYVLQAEDVGKYISFKVTPVAQTGSVTGAAIECILTAAVLPAGSVPENTPPTAANVTILGIAKQGEQLVGSYQYSDADGDPEGSSIFVWYRSNDAAGTGKTLIPGSTGVSYVLQAEDVGQYISFKVTPVAQTGSVTGAAIECILTAAVLPAGAIPENTPPIAANVVITGVAKAGEPLTGGYRYIDTDGDPEGSSLYRWYRSNDASGNGKTVIGGADTISYILTLEDIGKYISFEVTPVAVTGSAIGITVESNRTAAVIPAVTEPVNTAPTANNVSIYGTARVGQVLIGSYSYYDAESDIQAGSLYKWYRSDDSSGTGKTVIAGAAGLYYLLGQADLGKYISFEVTPVALTGIQFGTPTESIKIGPVAPPAVIPSNPTPTPAPEEQQEEITVDIKKGDSEEAAARIVVRRTTNADGTKTDTVVYDEVKALEAIEKLREEGFDLARIVVPDENDEVSETNIKIQSKALDIMAEGNINLEIDTENVKINIPKESLREFSGESPDDLYFNLVPVKKEEEKEQIAERARNGMLIMGITEGTLLSVIGRPMVIETNMPSAAVDITLPLNDIVIPADEEEREDFLNKLEVYVEHSDGDRELIKGEIVEFKDGVYGIKFRVMKFSTFTILRLDKAAEKSRECEILTVKSPAKTKLEGTRLSLTVQYETTNIAVKVTVSENASWALYSDSACKKVIKDNKLQLKAGSNKAYLKVTAEDETSTKIYTITVTRDKKPEVPKKVVFIATNADFSDAYAGEVLAKQLGGRVIQIGYADKDIQNIVKFITAHLIVKDDIYILGLDKAVKYDLEKILKEKGYKNIIRIGGADKYETAKKITEHLKPQKGTRVVIMSGEKQPNDGDSIKSACAAKGYPILYTKKDTLTDYTIKALKDLEPSEIYIVGDKSQISDKVIKELERVLQIKGSKIKRVKSGGDVI